MKEEALKYANSHDMLEEIDKEEIELFRKETEKSYKLLDGMRVEFVEYNPYSSYKELKKDVERGVLLISTLFNNSLLLPEELNLKFRAVHDFLHYLFNHPFGYDGEKQIFDKQKYFYSSEIGRKILYSEVVLQAAHKEYFGEFAKQKVAI